MESVTVPVVVCVHRYECLAQITGEMQSQTTNLLLALGLTRSVGECDCNHLARFSEQHVHLKELFQYILW